MVELPDLPPATVARIELAWRSVERDFIAADPARYRHQMFVLQRSAPYHSQDVQVTPAAADPRRVVLVMFDTIGPALCETARGDHWTADVLRSWAERQRDAAIVRAHRLNHVHGGSSIALENFSAKVERALTATPAWAQVQNLIHELHSVAIQGASRQSPAKKKRSSRFPRLAAWLAREMLAGGNLTPNRLQVLGGPDAKTTRQILKGTTAARDDVRQKVVTALQSAGRKVTFEDMPRD